jgi:hypothetical protein
MRVLRETFRFLGVDDAFRPLAAEQILNRIILPNVQQRLERLHLSWAVDLVKRSPVGAWIKRYSKAQGTSSEGCEDRRVPEDLRLRFREDIIQVQDLIGRDLSAWLAAM